MEDRHPKMKQTKIRQKSPKRDIPETEIEQPVWVKQYVWVYTNQIYKMADNYMASPSQQVRANDDLIIFLNAIDSL